ncbi:MAG: glycosyltransferase [Candidatus Cloacimonadota bacterium]|nr:glycosyltransferase [Candidatus Cloacimonadota bacterium]
MKKILFLTFSYAPYNVTGTFRAMRFIKYLPKYGIKPIVVTADQGKHHWNEKLYEEIPDEAEVYRLRSIFKDAQERSKITKQLYQRKKLLLNRIIFAILRYVKDIFFSPDIQNTWCIMNFFKLYKIIKENKIDIILVTGSPFSLFVLGSFLKIITKKKLIFDYRDPWYNNKFYTNQSFIRKKYNYFFEKFSLKNADAIIGTTDEIIDDIKNVYNYNGRTKTITNGYDPSEFVIKSEIPNYACKNLIFLYIGRFDIDDNSYNPSLILRSIQKYNEKQGKKIKLIVCGNINKSTIEFIDNNHMNDFIEIKGFLKRNELQKLLHKSHFFLHFWYPQKMKKIISIKIFEYALFKKPIFSINTQHSVVSSLIKKSGIGFFCENDKIDNIVNLFQKIENFCYNDFLDQINLNEIEKFNTKNLTKDLAQLINQIDLM